MTKFIIAQFFAGLLVLLAGSAISAQDRPEQSRRLIQTTGEAIASAEPDRARIDIGVTTEAPTSQVAAEQNAQKLTATLARLRGVLGQNANIRTISYTLSPRYRYPPQGGEPTLTGYTATNIVRVTIDDLKLVSRVIDAATQAGANQIQQLQFTVKDEQALQAQALRDASLKARRKADAIASALGLRVTRVINVTESGPTVFPVRDVAFAEAKVASTPIEPGTIEVRATVTLSVEIE